MMKRVTNMRQNSIKKCVDSHWFQQLWDWMCIAVYCSCILLLKKRRCINVAVCVLCYIIMWLVIVHVTDSNIDQHYIAWVQLSIIDDAITMWTLWKNTTVWINFNNLHYLGIWLLIYWMIYTFIYFKRTYICNFDVDNILETMRLNVYCALYTSALKKEVLYKCCCNM